MLWREAIGHQFRTARKNREQILAEVAAAAGVSTQYLSEVERGLKEPSSEIIEAIAAALDLTLSELTERISRSLRIPERGHTSHAEHDRRRPDAPRSSEPHTDGTPETPGSEPNSVETQSPEPPPGLHPAPLAPAGPVGAPNTNQPVLLAG